MTELRERLATVVERLVAEGEHPAPPCPDAVNLPMIRHWTEAVGDADPVYVDAAAAAASAHGGLVAPPAMIQVWSMRGLGARRAGSVADEPLRLLDEAGFTGVVATDCEQTYRRYLRHGEAPHSTLRMGGVTGPKKTGLGEGYFVTWHQRWYSGEERVAEMTFRVLKFRPGTGRSARPPVGSPPMPTIGADTRFYWDGAAAGELRIQRCAECGALRHPPGPMCPACRAVRRLGAPVVGRDYVVARGRGVVHSFVVHHHPPVPGRRPPFVVAVVELPEGVRVVGNVFGRPPEAVRIGMPVALTFERADDGPTLPQWTVDEACPDDQASSPARSLPDPGEGADARLPALVVELTPTFVVSTALATRDFTPVHHDGESARAQGAKAIFLNILTTMGLVQRYVAERVPGVVLAGISVRLGVPAYAGDTLTMTGRRVDDDTVEVRGTVDAGDHVTATVRLTRVDDGRGS